MKNPPKGYRIITEGQIEQGDLLWEELGGWGPAIGGEIGTPRQGIQRGCEEAEVKLITIPITWLQRMSDATIISLKTIHRTESNLTVEVDDSTYRDWRRRLQRENNLKTS